MGHQVEWNNSLKVCMGMRESWGQSSRGNGLGKGSDRG